MHILPSIFPLTTNGNVMMDLHSFAKTLSAARQSYCVYVNIRNIHPKNTKITYLCLGVQGREWQRWRGRTSPLSIRQSACVHEGSWLRAAQSQGTDTHKVTTHTSHRASRAPHTTHAPLTTALTQHYGLPPLSLQREAASGASPRRGPGKDE